MAQLSRVKQKIFGIDGPTNEFGQIGSDAAGAPINTKDLTVMQDLAQYTDGLFAMAPNADEPPSAEDINSLYNLMTSQLAYIMQAGIPEWETNTDYYIGSFVQVSGVIYVSIDGVDPTPNQGNNPTSSPAYWKLAFPITEVVNSQETFNAALVRVAANQYKFRDDIISIRFLYLSGGYLMTGGTSPLSGGDTWGYIETNNCQNIIFDSGAALHMGNERGYLEVNTDHCYLRNVNIIGTGTVASAIVQSFLLNADYATFVNCKSSSRLSSGNYGVFQGSGTASHNDTSSYIHCSVFDIEIQSGTLNGGFRNCKNLIDCQINDLTYSGAASSAFGYNVCINLENCIIDTMSGAGTTTRAYTGCNNLINCKALNISSITTAGNECRAFSNCNELVNCKAESITSSIDSVYGYTSCDDLTNCTAVTITHNGSVASKNAYGFYDCNNISVCVADDVDTNGAGGLANGFDTCNHITACLSQNNGTDGFKSCRHISASKSYNNGNNGISTCANISTSLSDNNAADGFVSCDRVNCSESTNNGGWGFSSVIQMNTNRSTANTSGQYNNAFADFAGAQAAADTAVGGYNG